jgi:hypothetical protein
VCEPFEAVPMAMGAVAFGCVGLSLLLGLLSVGGAVGGAGLDVGRATSIAPSRCEMAAMSADE